MKTKFTKKGRRILSAALCLLMMITALPMSAFAWTSEEGKSCTSSFGSYLLGYDGKYYYSMSDYSIVEVQAPYGYVLNSEPVYFDVTQDGSGEESGITVIEVVRSNRRDENGKHTLWF